MQKIILLLLCFFIAPAFSHADVKSPQKKTICLNMIVKDESAVIERCLGSVKHLIDYWVIVDTGSTDGTQKIIKKFMKDVPGELHESPWVNFAHNRNEALALAKNKADYLLIIDADEILEYTKDFALPVLDKDFFFLTVRQLDAADCQRIGLIKTSLDWKWEGVLHELLVCPAAITNGYLRNVIDICNTEGIVGGRSRLPTKEKYLKDAKILEEALLKEPNNSRYMCYLAQSYMSAEEYELAAKCFAKRIQMPSIDIQETFRAIYTLGDAQDKLGQTDAAIQTYFKAYEYRPTRAEPLFRAAVLYRKKGNYLLGYILSKQALTFPYPEGDVCIEYQSYDYAMLIEFANCALLLGKFDEGLEACAKLLANPRLPAEFTERVTSNYNLAKANLQKMASSQQYDKVMNK